MARHDTPLRPDDIERAYRRLERRRARPSILAMRIHYRLKAMDPMLAVILGVVMGVMASLAGAMHLGVSGAVLFVPPAVTLTGAAILAAARAWARERDATPASPDRGLGVLERARGDARVMATVQDWLLDSGLGSLSQAQVEALEQALDRIDEIRTWERDHAKVHEFLETQGVMSQVRAVDLGQALPKAQVAANDPKRRL